MNHLIVTVSHSTAQISVGRKTNVHNVLRDMKAMKVFAGPKTVYNILMIKGTVQYVALAILLMKENV